MNIRGAGGLYITIAVLAGLLIVAVSLAPAWNFTENLSTILFGEQENEQINSEAAFATLILKIKDMGKGDVERFLFGTGKDYLMVGFRKGQDQLSRGALESCDYSLPSKEGRVPQPLFLQNPIFRPKTQDCKEDQSCLCLCKSDVDLENLCNAPGTYACQGYDFDLIDFTNRCYYFYLSFQEGLINLELEREDDRLYFSKYRPVTVSDIQQEPSIQN